MLKGTIRKHGDEILNFDIPQSLSDVPLSRYIDFLVESRNMDAAPIQATTKAVSAFYGIDLSILTGMEYGNDDSGAGTVTGLYGYAIGLISGSAKNEQRTFFEYRGEQYYIPSFLLDVISGREIAPALSVIETIEASEAQRLVSQKLTAQNPINNDFADRLRKIAANETLDTGVRAALIAAIDEEIKGANMEANDPNGSTMYTGYLKTLAILRRKDGEVLPFSDSEREVLINERVKHFSGINIQTGARVDFGIDAQTALDVDFFLTGFLEFYGKTLPAIGFLSRLTFGLVVELLPVSKPKRSAKAGRTTKKHSGASDGGG